MVDLGAWMLGHYRIPAVSDPDAEPEAGALPPPVGGPPDDDDDAAP